MFREMVRKKQQLTKEEAIELLKKEPRGVLSVLGDDGYPYGVPIDHWYNEEDGWIYFHSGKSGHKVDAIRSCSKASFCVIAEDNVMEEEFTTYFKSVIAFGKIRILEDMSEIRSAIEILSDKYCPVDVSLRDKEIEGAVSRLGMLEFTIEHLTGKEAKELLAKRK